MALRPGYMDTGTHICIAMGEAECLEINEIVRQKREMESGIGRCGV